jgi:hypothetical protein
MAAKLPDGAIVQMGTTYASPVTVSAISNANPAVATATNTYASGDYILISSGWSNLNNRVVRLSAAAAGNFTMEGIDTTSTALYPAAGGAGTGTKISAWTQIAQIMNFATSGGDQQFATYSFLEQNFETQIPTMLSAMTMTLDIADDPSMAGYLALKVASDARAARSLMILMPDNSRILYQGYVSLNETPSVTKGSLMQVKASFALQSRPVRYAT